MKFTSKLYQELIVPKSRFSSYLKDWTTYGELVTFGPNVREPIHNWFYFKQGFSKFLVDMLLHEFKIEKPALVLDPFCGVGTTPVTSKQMGYSSIGVDVIPLCVFVTNVKLEDQYDRGKLRDAISRVCDADFKEPTIEYPDIKIVKRAFEPGILRQILFFKEVIAKETDDKIRNFLMLGLLSIIQDVSNAKRDGAFLRIVKKQSIPNVRKVLRQKLIHMYNDLVNTKQPKILDFLERQNVAVSIEEKSVLGRAYEGDARDLSFIDDEVVDAVITSPPYPNRFDYTRIYSPELCLYFVKDFQTLRRIRYQTIRSHVEARYSQPVDLCSDELNNVLDELCKRELNNPKIPEMVKGYFEDIYLSLAEIHRVMRSGGKVAIVLGSAAWSGVAVNADLITAEIAEDLGFTLIEIRVANLRGTSAQQARKFGEVQLRESIVLLTK
ncbi:MAG: hypothetical protein QXQ94_10305 [Candidatus Bathyarchaeia archaeon]